MANFELPQPLIDDTRTAWQIFLDQVEPIRPQLHAYCRRLTRTLWDAEDLVQESLIRGFGGLAALGQSKLEHPRAYLLRIATNAWIDRVRLSKREALADELPEPAAAPHVEQEVRVREAGTRLLALAPRERAAVLLKDVFDASLEEIAAVLDSTTGAVKSALHRGRTRLREEEHRMALDPSSTQPNPPSVALVDRFVAAFNARDRDALVALLLERAPTNVFGAGIGFGADSGWLRAVLDGHDTWPAEHRYESRRIQRGLYEGEPLVLAFGTRNGNEALEEVWRFEEENGRIAYVRDYGFCPETVAEVARALGLRARSLGHRFPTPAPGRFYC